MPPTTGTSSSSGERKFDAILDNVIDTHKIDFKHVRRWLCDYLQGKKTNHDYIELITDLIVDHLRKERFPDAKVIQCEIADIGLLSSDKSKRLMRRFWEYANDLQDKPDTYNASKYRKTSSSSGSTTKISTSSRSDQYHYYNPHYAPPAHSSYNYCSQYANQL